MRERGTGSLKLRGRIWWCKYYLHGRPIEISCETADESKAKKILKRKLAEVETGTHGDARNIRYEELRDALYSHYEIKKRKSLRRDADGHPHLDKVARLDRFFCGFRAAEIDVDQIDRFIKEEQGRGLADATINRSLSALRRMFNLARKRGKLRHVPPFELLPESAPRKGFFEPEQYHQLMAVLPDYLKLPVAIGFFCGMREGEILGLDWSQIDFLRGVICLRSGETKNDEAREAPIVAPLRMLLQERYAKRQAECRFVCYRLDRKGHAVQVRGFRKAWYTACMKAKLGAMFPVTDAEGNPELRPLRGPHSKPKPKMEYRGTIFHDLRRSGVRNLVRAGVPEKVAMAISGHKTRSVFDRYNITSGKDVAEAGRKLELFLGQKHGDNSGTICTEMQQSDLPVY